MEWNLYESKIADLMAEINRLNTKINKDNTYANVVNWLSDDVWWIYSRMINTDPVYLLK